jgi:hypothetical protein
MAVAVAEVPEGKIVWVDAIAIKGTVQENGLQIELQPGPVATKAIRVFSEPSHTLLVTVVDYDYNESAAGKAWLKQNALKGSLRSVTDLPSGTAKVLVPKRPADDVRIAVWINGSWPEGEEGDRLVSDGMVGGANFGFTTRVEATGDPQHCCSIDNCNPPCIDCSGPQFTCCSTPGCCFLECGWVQCCP